MEDLNFVLKFKKQQTVPYEKCKRIHKHKKQKLEQKSGRVIVNIFKYKPYFRRLTEK